MSEIGIREYIFCAACTAGQTVVFDPREAAMRGSAHCARCGTPVVPTVQSIADGWFQDGTVSSVLGDGVAGEPFEPPPPGSTRSGS